MKTEKLGQEPAYPCEENFMSQFGDIKEKHKGMSKRFYAACAAMQGIISNSYLTQKIAEVNTSKINIIPQLISAAYEYADELLKQETDENS